MLWTKRLILRPFLASDLDAFFEYASVPGVGEMAGWKHHETKEESEKILSTFVNQQTIYALFSIEQQKVIGSIGVHHRPNATFIPGERSCELGFVLSKTEWGKGLMAEAVKALLRHLMDDLHYDVVWVGHFYYNDQSKRVIQKCGFTYFGERLYHHAGTNKDILEVVYFYRRDSLQP
jgi:ribosomal-protein-alanine N-acetyltransferase